MTETWLSAQDGASKTVELAPCEFDLISFPRQSRSRGGGIATVYKSILSFNITFKTNFDFTHTSIEAVQASITLQHSTLHFFYLCRPPPKRRSDLTDSMYGKNLPFNYPSVDIPSHLIKHITNKVEKRRASIASVHVTSTLTTGITTAAFSSFF